MDTLARASTNGSKRSFFESVYDGSVQPLLLFDFISYFNTKPKSLFFIPFSGDVFETW